MRKDEIQNLIELLPKGSVTRKRIDGKDYYYHRVYEQGKRKEKYIPNEQVDSLRRQIELRKRLVDQLNQDSFMINESEVPFYHDFRCIVKTGTSLRTFSSSVKKFKTRECFDSLKQYLQSDSEKVMVLYGLRRTGKTTMLRQLLSLMSDEELAQTAFIQCPFGKTLADLNHDLKLLEERGIKTVMIDEITMLPDFIEGAALLADIYATSGMKILLSGTDSLGFVFAEDEQLYDRCILLHTTFISYREFERLLGGLGIDEYICYGGTMSSDGVHYNETSPFSSKQKTDEYVNSSIAKNIQHSLKYYQDEGHFRHLHDLYCHHELTSVIQRVVEDMNHRFVLEVLTAEFMSHDLSVSARNLRKDYMNPIDVLDTIDMSAVTKRLKEKLNIFNLNEQTVQIQNEHVIEIKEYLKLLDIIDEVDVLHMSALSNRTKRVIVTQPGLRYAQADALVESLIQDEKMIELSVYERNEVIRRIRNEVKGRMLEDIVLLQTKLARPDCHVFVLQFAVGEFDMVVFDSKSSTCELYEIKYSTSRHISQSRHLKDEEKIRQTEYHFGAVKKRVVLYRGDTLSENGIEFVNVEEYLRKL